MGNVWTTPENDENKPADSLANTPANTPEDDMQASILASVLPMAKVEAKVEVVNNLMELTLRFYLNQKTVETFWPVLSKSELLQLRGALQTDTEFSVLNYGNVHLRPAHSPEIFANGENIVLNSHGHISRLPRAVFGQPLLQALEPICKKIE